MASDWGHLGVFESVSQRITSTPTVTPVTAAGFFARREISPSRKSPSMPPEKIPASCHHASSALSTFIMANAASVPTVPQTSVAE